MREPFYLSPYFSEFPDGKLSDKDGLLAIGGNLNVLTLIKAYRNGIFPWYDEKSPILWWSPNPRFILFPEKIKISKSLLHTLNKNKFQVKMDTCFEKVIHLCAENPRKEEDGTWITEEMKLAYIALHRAGYAHSVETFMDGNLVGGLYGVSLGRAFFGESMFYLVSDASKIALFHLAKKLIQWDFYFIDAQVVTQHLQSLGAETIHRNDFFVLLKKAIQFPDKQGSWENL